jgi:hypothetical protein
LIRHSVLRCCGLPVPVVPVITCLIRHSVSHSFLRQRPAFASIKTLWCCCYSVKCCTACLWCFPSGVRYTAPQTPWNLFTFVWHHLHFLHSPYCSLGNLSLCKTTASLWDFRFPRRRIWRCLRSGLFRCVIW